MNVLAVTAGGRTIGSDSRKKSEQILTELESKNSKLKVVKRDLLASPLPHLGEQEVRAFFLEPTLLSLAERESLRLSDQCVSELLVADVLLIATPMWNFSVPSALKAWVDHIVRVGHTFEMSAQGPRGLIKNKRAIIVTSAGGIYSGTSLEAWDACGAYLRNILQFLGFEQIEWVRSEGRAVPGGERVNHLNWPQ